MNIYKKVGIIVAVIVSFCVAVATNVTGGGFDLFEEVVVHDNMIISNGPELVQIGMGTRRPATPTSFAFDTAVVPMGDIFFAGASNSQMHFVETFNNGFDWITNFDDDGNPDNVDDVIMSLMPDGSLGIGTTAPAQLLDVAGGIIGIDYYSGDGSQGIDMQASITVVGFGLCTVTWKDGLLTDFTC